MEFSKQRYWSGLPFPTPGDLPDPEIKPTSPALTSGIFSTAPPGGNRQSLTFLGLQFSTSISFGIPGSSAGKESTCNAANSGWIPRSERTAGKGIGYPLSIHGLSW